MGFQNIVLDITLTKDEFINILLLNGDVNRTSSDGIQFTILGTSDHFKYGVSGVEDGSTHTFKTTIRYGDRFTQGVANIKSNDGGATYSGKIYIELYPDDNLSE